MDNAQVRIVYRAAGIAGTGFALGGIFLAVGIWLAANRLATGLQRSLDNHAQSTHGAGERIGDGLKEATEGLVQHASAVREAGSVTAHPEIRVIEPIPIRDPVKVEGVEDDRSLNINAKVGKEE